MVSLLIEVAGTHSCTGCSGLLPEVVDQFIKDTGAQAEFKFYPVWDADCTSMPDYILTHIAEMRKGSRSSSGFFLNGHWLPLAPHNAEHVVEARNKLVEAAGMASELKRLSLLGREMDELKVSGSQVNMLQLANNKVHEWGSFSTDFDYIWFFEGSIKGLSIDACPVEKFTYMGYDVLKLIEVAKRHPELFQDKKDDARVPDIEKADIGEVTVRLLTQKDLLEGRHPCVINGCTIDKDSKLHKAVAEKFGGWGYEATCGSNVCGFMGIMPKDISYRDANFLPPGELPHEAVLLLTCYAGGGVFGPRFHRIGIAKKMIYQAIRDAKSKGYLRIEAYAHPEVEPVLVKCGFSRVAWETDGNAPQAFYKLDL